MFYFYLSDNIIGKQNWSHLFRIFDYSLFYLYIDIWFKV